MSEGLAFYRCMLCRSVVSKWDIHKHQGCPNCGHARIMPCNLTLAQKVIQFIKHPQFWKWHEPLQSD
jgi:DNA-directed RNA polymerase subunit RPC12/RpoP